MNVTLIKCNGNKENVRIIELSSLLEKMKVETKEELITNLRYYLQFKSSSAIANHQTKIPKICFASSFKKVEGQPQLVQYAGLVRVSIGRLTGIEESEMVRDMVAKFPQTAAAFVGADAQSVEILVAFVRPDGSLPQTLNEAQWFHSAAYLWATRFFEGQIDYPLSIVEPSVFGESCMSYDPGLYVSTDLCPVKMEQPIAEPLQKGKWKQKESAMERLNRLMPTCDSKQILSTLFETSLRKALNEVGDGWREDNKPLLVALCANCFRSGVPQEEVVQGVLTHFDWPEMEVRETVRNNYVIGKGFGSRPCIVKEQMLVMKMDEFMKRRYEFRRNTQVGVVEYRERNSFQFHFAPVTETVLNSIALNAMEEGLQFWDRDVKRYVYSDRIALFSPIIDFLGSLPQWDGIDRIGVMADAVPCSNAHWKVFFHRWFLCMVAHWQGIDANHANSTSPILVGKQGYRKSTFCLSLMPPVLRSYYADSIDFSSKRDAETYLNRFGLVNIDEFDQITEAQQAYLKHILQKPVVNVRKSHQAYVQELRRYASFIATSNHTDLLSDTSGSRRFICVNVTAPISVTYPIDYGQLYAQAVHEVNAGERYWFTYEDEQILMAENRAFEQSPASEQLFVQYFRAAEEDEECEELLAADILGRLQKRSGFKLSQAKLVHFGRNLNKLGVRSKRTRFGNLYYVVERKKTEDVA